MLPSFFLDNHVCPSNVVFNRVKDKWNVITKIKNYFFMKLEMFVRNNVDSNFHYVIIKKEILKVNSI